MSGDAPLDALSRLPAAMRSLPQWLVWRYETKNGETKPRKMPYYVSGRRRRGGQGTPADRAELSSFESADARMRAGRFDGIGFAFLPGDGLVGIDLDGAIDVATGEVLPRFQAIIEACASYTEVSPSGAGVHIVCRGETETFKSDDIGVEVYCRSQYFTCTGAAVPGWPGTAPDVEPLLPNVLEWLRQLVDEAKAAARDRREQAASPPVGVPARPPDRGGRRSGDDFRAVNDAALQRLAAWVTELLPEAKHQPGTGAWRVSSRALGRELEEDLSIAPEGIRDFGTDRTYTAIDLVAEYRGLSPIEALRWLAERIGYALPRLRLVGKAGGKAEGAGDKRERPSRPQRRGRRDEDFPTERFDYLRKHVALIAGTDQVWHDELREMWPISALAHVYGNEAVRAWKGGNVAWRRGEPGRWTVLQKNVVFDPTRTVDPDTHINLFDGFKMKPKAGSIEPIMLLIDHLLSEIEDAKQRAVVKHAFLCWLAYPLQHPGAKIHWAVVMCGDEGSGKNMLWKAMAAIYGPYAIEVGQEELDDRFNDWRSGRLLAIGDEVSTRAELANTSNKLKSLITSATVQINPKNLARKTEFNFLNIGFNSNEVRALIIDVSDRHYLVIGTPGRADSELYRQLKNWYANGGAAHLMDYLLKYETSDFDPYEPPPRTEAKEVLIDMSLNAASRFWIDWQKGELGLPYWTCSVAQAYRAFRRYCERNGILRYPDANVFMAYVRRISLTYKKKVSTKVMKVRTGPSPLDDHSTRMFLVLQPPVEAQGAWATEACNAFEMPLRKYLHGNRAYDDDGADLPAVPAR